MNDIVLVDVINEGVRPEASVKIGTGEFGTEGVADVSVRPSDKTILMGRVRTGRVYVVTKLF